MRRADPAAGECYNGGMQATVRTVAVIVIGGMVFSACASRRAELEYEKPVTTVWTGKEPPPAPVAPTDTPATGAAKASAATRVPVVQATSTTVPRPSSWVRPDPVQKR